MTAENISVTADFVNRDTLKNQAYEFNGMPDENEKANVGTYDLDIPGKNWQEAVGGNYTVANVTSHKGTLTITPREVTFKVTDQTRVYGDLNPRFEGELSNHKGWDSVDGDAIHYVTTATERSKVGDYVVTVDSANTDWTSVLGQNYTMKDGGVTAGSLHITPRSIGYKADDKMRGVGEDNPSLTGGFVRTDGKDGEGLMSWDKQYVNELQSDDFFTTTTKESAAGVYYEDIRTKKNTADSIALFTDESVRNNYVITDLQYGTMRIIQRKVYTPETLLPDLPGVPATGGIIEGSELDIPKCPEHKHHYRSIPDENTKVPLMPTDETEEKIDAKQDPIWKEVVKENKDVLVTDSEKNGVADQAASENKDTLEENGGEIDRERRGSLRFMTIEDTGINLKPAAIFSNTIRIDASSRADGGSTVVIEGEGGDVRVIGTKLLLKGTTIDTLKETAVIRVNSKEETFMTLAGLSEGKRVEALAAAAAEGGAPVTEDDEDSASA